MFADDEDFVVVRRAPTRSMQVYVIRFGAYLKVGVTGHVPTRLRALPGAVIKPDDVDLTDIEPLCAVTGGEDTERLLHALLADARVTGEWFRARPELVAVFRGMMTDESRARAFGLADADGFARHAPAPVDF